MYDGVTCEISLFLFTKKNICREKMYRIVVSNYFENFILSIIILSSCKLIVDTYIDFDSDSKTNVILA